MAIISTETSKILLAEAIKSNDPEAFLAGVILAYEKTGTSVENLTRYLEDNQMINYQKIKSFVDNTKKERKKYPQEE